MFAEPVFKILLYSHESAHNPHQYCCTTLHATMFFKEFDDSCSFQGMFFVSINKFVTWGKYWRQAENFDMLVDEENRSSYTISWSVSRFSSLYLNQLLLHTTYES